MSLPVGVRKSIPKALVLVLALTIWGRTAADLAIEFWTEPSASQGLIIAPLAAGLVWMNRRNTFALPDVPNPRGHLLVATAALILLAGKFGADFFLQRAS